MSNATIVCTMVVNMTNGKPTLRKERKNIHVKNLRRKKKTGIVNLFYQIIILPHLTLQKILVYGVKATYKSGSLPNSGTGKTPVHKCSNYIYLCLEFLVVVLMN